jgi:hypothetical protein
MGPIVLIWAKPGFSVAPHLVMLFLEADNEHGCLWVQVLDRRT